MSSRWRGRPPTCREAVDWAAALQPDVVLMDLRMPMLDGVSAIRMLAEKGVGPRVLVLTTLFERGLLPRP